MNSNELTAKNKSTKTDSLQGPVESDADAARRAYVFAPVPLPGRNMSAEISADVADELRRDKWADHRKKVALAASLDNRRIFHRDSERDSAGALYESKLAERDYFNRPGNSFVGHVNILPGGILARVSPGAALHKGKPNGGGLRGDVVGFSPQSQTNLTKKLMAIQWRNLASTGKRAVHGRAVFLGLTFHDDLLPEHIELDYDEAGQPFVAEGNPFDAKKVKRCLDNFHKALRRFANFHGMIWKMEIEDRKSGPRKGEFLPHFHCLIIFHSDQNKRVFAKWARSTWLRITGGENLPPKKQRHFKKHGTDCRIVYGQEGPLLNYLAKYLGKTFTAEGIKAGRVWGVKAGIDTNTGQAMSKDNALDFAPMVSFKFSSYVAWREFVTAVRAWAVGKSKRLMELSDDCRGFRILGNGWQLADTILVGLDFSTVPIIED